MEARECTQLLSRANFKHQFNLKRQFYTKISNDVTLKSERNQYDFSTNQNHFYSILLKISFSFHGRIMILPRILAIGLYALSTLTYADPWQFVKSEDGIIIDKRPHTEGLV